MITICRRNFWVVFFVSLVLICPGKAVHADDDDDILLFLPAILAGAPSPPPYIPTLGIAPSHIIAESPDRMFDNPGQWPTAIKKAWLWKYYGLQVDPNNSYDWGNRLTPSKLVAYANANTVRVGCEFGDFQLGVDPTFATSRQLNPIFQAGGDVDYLHLDGPVRRIIKGINSHPMALTLAEAADYLVDYWIWVHNRYPNIKIGLLSNLPNWDYTASLPGANGHFTDQSGVTYAQVLDAVYTKLTAAGQKLSFVEIDCPYNYYVLTDNKTKFLRIKKWCRDRGIQFFIIINSEASGAEEFQRRSRNYLFHLELDGIRSDLAILQSWYPYPSENLPESKAYTFTHTINAVTYRGP